MLLLDSAIICRNILHGEVAVQLQFIIELLKLTLNLLCHFLQFGVSEFLHLLFVHFKDFLKFPASVFVEFFYKELLNNGRFM